MHTSKFQNGHEVIVGLAGEVPARGLIMNVWDNSWYHIQFFPEPKSRIRPRDMIIERARLTHVSEPKSSSNNEGSTSKVAKAERMSTLESRVISPSATSFQNSSNENSVPCGDESNLVDNYLVDIEQLKRGLEISALAKRRADLERLHQALLEEKRKLQASFKVSFHTRPDFVGVLIGRNGSNIAQAEEIPGVKRVDVKDCEVTIYAENCEAAESARDLLEIESLDIPVTARERRLIIGRGGKNVRDLQARAGLVKLQIDDRGNIQLLGSRKAVAFGKRILAAITRFVLEQQALEEVNRTFLESDVMDDSTYNDSYIFSDDGISYNIQVPEDKIGLVIGSKGSTVKEIREKTGCRIEMVKDALRPGCTWTVSSANSDAADEAVAWIQELISEPPLGSMHDGVVSKVVDYGVLVSFGRREGLIRLSHLSNSGTLNRGDQVRVSITGIDHRSRICLALADSVETTRAIPRPGPSRRAPAPAEAVHREIASAEKSVNANVLSNSVDNVVSTPWPSLGGSEERTVSVGQYAAWSQRVKEQRERARSEAEMRKVGPWSARETVGCAPAASEASSRPTQSADSPRRNVVDVVRSTSQGAAAATSASNVRVRRDSGPESMSSPKVRAAADFDADERGLNGMMPQGAGSRARTEWPGRDGVANGYASNVAVTRDVAVTRVTAASDVAVTRHLPHASDVAVTRRDLKGDADYSRDYTRYAPSAAAPGGTVSAGRGGRVQRMSDRDGGEEGGAFVVPSSGMRGRGRGRDF